MTKPLKKAAHPKPAHAPVAGSGQGQASKLAWPVLLATGFYISYIPVKFLGKRKWSGAGLFGTFEALLVVPFLPDDPMILGPLLAAAIVLSCWICGLAEEAFGGHDDPRIVLDEMVGLWTATAFLPKSIPVIAAAFVLFRLLDSLKLPPYRWLERLPGGTGVVADDIGAAVLANLGVRWAMTVWPGLAR